MIKDHDCVVLTSDLPGEGLVAGDVGTVMHIHRDSAAYEVHPTHRKDRRRHNGTPVPVPDLRSADGAAGRERTARVWPGAESNHRHADFQPKSAREVNC